VQVQWPEQQPVQSNPKRVVCARVSCESVLYGDGECTGTMQHSQGSNSHMVASIASIARIHTEDHTNGNIIDEVSERDGAEAEPYWECCCVGVCTQPACRCTIFWPQKFVMSKTRLKTLTPVCATS
jgi:hypothetical protein